MTVFGILEDGWVQVRSRSRFSPANKLESEDLSISKSTTNLKPRTSLVRPQAKTRYHLPSSAKSLPSLAVAAREKSNSPQAMKKTEKDNLNPIKKSFGKYIEECAKRDELKKAELARKSQDLTFVEKIDEKIVLTEREDEEKIALIDQDDEDSKFDEEIKRNNEAEEKLQKEIKELESSEIEVRKASLVNHFVNQILDGH